MLENTGVLFVYLIARKDEESGYIEVRGIHSLQYLLKDFLKHITFLRSHERDIESEDILEMYCILGTSSQTEAFMDIIKRVQNNVCDQFKDWNFDYQTYILQNLEEQGQRAAYFDYAAWLMTYHTFCFNRLYLLRQFHLPKIDGNLDVCCLSLGLEHDDRLMWMQNAVQIWLNSEAPQIYGKQVIINSFWLNDLNGRRIIGALPQHVSGGYYLLVEGGKKVQLNSGSAAFMNEQFGYRDINLLSLNDINTLISNPIYSHGIYFQPYELYEEWQKVFQYALAVLDVEWTAESLENVYELFMDFMRRQICEWIEAEPMLSKGKFYNAYLIKIAELREFLCCKEQAVISNDWLHMMQNRFIFLNHIYTLLNQFYEKEICKMTQTKTCWKGLTV